MSNPSPGAPTPEAAPPGGIPPHILWPGMIVGILLLSVVANIVLIVAATSDGGAQIEADYYERALAWDEELAQREQSEALGWQTDLTIEPTAPAGQVVLVTVADHAGQPVHGLTGALKMRHATQAQWRSLELEPITGSLGQYKVVTAFDRPGLWDFTVDVQDQGGDHFVQTLRRELSR